METVFLAIAFLCGLAALVIYLAKVKPSTFSQPASNQSSGKDPLAKRSFGSNAISMAKVGSFLVRGADTYLKVVARLMLNMRDIGNGIPDTEEEAKLRCSRTGDSISILILKENDSKDAVLLLSVRGKLYLLSNVDFPTESEANNLSNTLAEGERFAWAEQAWIRIDTGFSDITVDPGSEWPLPQGKTAIHTLGKSSTGKVILYLDTWGDYDVIAQGKEIEPNEISNLAS